MINREELKCVPGAATPSKVFTCSTGDVASGAAINGRIIDRLGLGGGQIFENVMAGISVLTTVGSTAADKRITLAVKIQHGDQASGSDMADYSTGQQSADKNYFTTAETTTLQNWSTEVLALSHESTYNVIAAKRYIRAVGVVTRAAGATSTAASSIDTVNANLYVTFTKPDRTKDLSLSTSTSTSTST